MALSILVAIIIVGLVATRVFTHLNIINSPQGVEGEYNPIMRYSFKKFGLWYTHIVSSAVALLVLIYFCLHRFITGLFIGAVIALYCAINDFRVYIRVRKEMKG